MVANIKYAGHDCIMVFILERLVVQAQNLIFFLGLGPGYSFSILQVVEDTCYSVDILLPGRLTFH